MYVKSLQVRINEETHVVVLGSEFNIFADFLQSQLADFTSNVHRLLIRIDVPYTQITMSPHVYFSEQSWTIWCIWMI